MRFIVNQQKNLLISSMPIYGTLVVVFCMVLITLSEPLMGWVWVLCGCAITIAYLRLKHRLPCVKNLTLNLLAIFCMCLLIYLSDTFGLMATMINLLVVAACLKLINLQTPSDYHLVLVILFFLIACGFLYHQSIYIVAYYFACLVVLFVTAFLLNRGSLDIQQSVQQSIKMILQAFPIMLLLFIVAPRLPPFWQTPADASTQTGLSEQITPGDIANLAQSDELVFRAEFEDGKLPTPEQRYWRSIVLDYFDGKSWMLARDRYEYTQVYKPNTLTMQQTSNLNYKYLIIAQPNNTRWLYSLDIPVIDTSVGNVDVAMNYQYQLFQPQVGLKPSFYVLNSYTQAPKKQFDTIQDSRRYLQVPENGNPKTVKWIAANINSKMSFTEKINTINTFFLSQNFMYTLQPPLMQRDPVDTFLFDNQRGFCSHYASAMTYMLRLANIPARMVAGYQGGQEQGQNVISVHQFDAHAWVEAYDDNYGWIKYDPTALIAPERALTGLISALSATETSLLSRDTSNLFNLPIIDYMSDLIAIVDHNWSQLVINFDQKTQVGLIEKLFGELTYKSLFTFLILSIVIIVLFVTVLFLPYKTWLSKDRKTSLQIVLTFLEKHGFKKCKNESLNTFITRIKRDVHPNFFNKLDEFSQIFYTLEYKVDLSDEQKENLKTDMIKSRNILIKQTSKQIKLTHR